MRPNKRELCAWLLCLSWCIGAIWVQFETLSVMPVLDRTESESLSTGETLFCAQRRYQAARGWYIPQIKLPEFCRIVVVHHNQMFATAALLTFGPPLAGILVLQILRCRSPERRRPS